MTRVCRTGVFQARVRCRVGRRRSDNWKQTRSVCERHWRQDASPMLFVRFSQAGRPTRHAAGNVSSAKNENRLSWFSSELCLHRFRQRPSPSAPPVRRTRPSTPQDRASGRAPTAAVLLLAHRQRWSTRAGLGHDAVRAGSGSPSALSSTRRAFSTRGVRGSRPRDARVARFAGRLSWGQVDLCACAAVQAPTHAPTGPVQGQPLQGR